MGFYDIIFVSEQIIIIMTTKQKIKEDRKVSLALSKLESLISSSKTVMNTDDLAAYTGFAKSSIYKFVHRKEIPYFKPTGKQLFFSKEKVDAWLMEKSVKSKDEIAELARSRTLLK